MYKADILELYSLKEIPTPPKGKKYFACIGGKRNFQCFLESNSISRGEFMELRKNELEDFLTPIYIDKYIQVRQDAKYAIPGFFIISPIDEYWSLAELPRELYEKCNYMSFKIRKILSDLPEVEEVYLYYDEHYKKPSSAHFWVLPIFRERKTKNPKIATCDIWKYMDEFQYIEQKEIIKKYVTYLKNKLNEEI